MGSDTSGAHPECDPTYPGWMFNRTATVDIYYAHKTNGTYDQG
jgi:hypothetical protein